MQITSYENKGFHVLYNTHADFRGEISEKNCVLVLQLTSYMISNAN